jgi:hypothetical protein
MESALNCGALLTKGKRLMAFQAGQLSRQSANGTGVRRR